MAKKVAVVRRSVAWATPVNTVTSFGPSLRLRHENSVPMQRTHLRFAIRENGRITRRGQHGMDSQIYVFDRCRYMRCVSDLLDGRRKKKKITLLVGGGPRYGAHREQFSRNERGRERQRKGVGKINTGCEKTKTSGGGSRPKRIQSKHSDAARRNAEMGCSYRHG
jgi:hypothetical protein